MAHLLQPRPLAPFGSRRSQTPLDLPFVTHIFLLRTIWESGYEKQVVSRACRLGCEGPVVVDQVLARGTAEEALFDRVASRSAPASEAEKIDSLLRGLRLLRA